MILALVLAAQLQHKALFSKVELAITCRYYKAGKAKSRHQLYLIKGDGTGRRLLPTVDEPWRVRWVGRDRLEWDVYEDDSRVTMTSKLSPWNPVRVPENDDSEEQSGPWPGFEWVTDQLALPNGQALPIGKNGQIVAEHVLETYNLSLGGVTVDCMAFRSYAVRHRSTRRTLFVSTSWSSSSGDYCALFDWNELDPPGTARALFHSACDYDFEPDRDVYAWATHRDSAPLDPKNPDGKQVWTGAVGVGSQKLGKRVFPVSGVAWATSVAIRPSK